MTEPKTRTEVAMDFVTALLEDPAALDGTRKDDLRELLILSIAELEANARAWLVSSLRDARFPPENRKRIAGYVSGRPGVGPSVK